MSNAAQLIDADKFFAPVEGDAVDSLIARYNHDRDGVEQIASYFDMSEGPLISHFINGNSEPGNSRHSQLSAERIFNLDGAIASLNASYWDATLKMTDVLDIMPAKRRQEWYESILHMKTPDFTESTVRATLFDMLQSRQQFFAERVDGIFRALSKTHLTNCPQGFRKRMIVSCLIDNLGFTSWRVEEYIHDLRFVISRFMGRDEPKPDATRSAIQAIRKYNGQWHSLDGGALRMRIYNGVGTAHIEVHPDMAWRLNAILASMYPGAIPSEFRQKPKRQPKAITPIMRPLPFQVISVLSGMSQGVVWREQQFRRVSSKVPNTLSYSAGNTDKHIMAQVGEVLTMIGGTWNPVDGWWVFDYDPEEALDEVICSGCVPDKKSHQFYPTPDSIGEYMVDMLRIEPGMSVLEPSAGTGNLVSLLPPDVSVTAVEISSVHCKVVQSRRPDAIVINGDFMKTAAELSFDRVIMNPPFDRGQWQSHLEHAAGHLNPTGKLIAVLPASAIKKDLLPGWGLKWIGPFENEFAGTSISVVILEAER